MKILKTMLVAAVLALPCAAAHADDCPDGTLTFNFEQLEVTKAFAIFADFAGLTPNIDQSIPDRGRIVFHCMPWQTAARDLAAKYRLNMRIENRTLYLSKK